jgi:hypothetical protein
MFVCILALDLGSAIRGHVGMPSERTARTPLSLYSLEAGALSASDRTGVSSFLHAFGPVVHFFCAGGTFLDFCTYFVSTSFLSMSFSLFPFALYPTAYEPYMRTKCYPSTH